MLSTSLSYRKTFKSKRKVSIPLLHVRKPKNEQPVLNAENDKMCSFKYHHPKNNTKMSQIFSINK